MDRFPCEKYYLNRTSSLEAIFVRLFPVIDQNTNQLSTPLQDSYGGTSLALMKRVKGFSEPVYAMGLPGENKYGTVRFYRRSGESLEEVPEMKLDARYVFYEKLKVRSRHLLTLYKLF